MIGLPVIILQFFLSGIIFPFVAEAKPQHRALSLNVLLRWNFHFGDTRGDPRVDKTSVTAFYTFSSSPPFGLSDLRYCSGTVLDGPHRDSARYLVVKFITRGPIGTIFMQGKSY